MPKDTSFMDIANEILDEDKEVIDEFIKEEIMPLVEYNRNIDREIFNKAYAEMLELEEV